LDFGDGSSNHLSTTPQLTHSYSNPGSYRASVVTTGTGSDSAYSNSVIVRVTSGNGPIPNLIGKPESEVRAMFNPKMEFSLGTVTYTSSSITAGTVISQQPPAGTAAPIGTQINIVVAKEPASNDEDLIVVPNVVGMDHAKAEALLQKVGLAVYKKFVKPADKGKYVVTSQSPAADTKAKRGTKVTLTWARAPTNIR